MRLNGGLTSAERRPITSQLVMSSINTSISYLEFLWKYSPLAVNSRTATAKIRACNSE